MEQFETAMRAQLKYYTHRQLCDCIGHGSASESEIAQAQYTPLKKYERTEPCPAKLMSFESGL